MSHPRSFGYVNPTFILRTIGGDLFKMYVIVVERMLIDRHAFELLQRGSRDLHQAICWVWAKRDKNLSGYTDYSHSTFIVKKRPSSPSRG